jgi:protein involved in polysaccharide export with SLBB domain
MTSGPAHEIEPPDVLLVEVLEALPGRPISGERLVRPDGRITLGYYGDVYVAGLTLPEVKEKIVMHLRKYLKDETLGLYELDEKTGQPKLIEPKDSSAVFVDVTAYNSKNYYVQGDVQIPGKLPYTGGETVLDAIQYAGGLLASADRSKVRLIRNFPKGSPVKELAVNYEQISMGTDSSTNYQMLPGDRLVVPRDPRSSGDIGSTPPQRKSESSLPSRASVYNPDASTQTAGTQLEFLRAVERRLSEVERKLDQIIERLDRVDSRAEQEHSEMPDRKAADRTRRRGTEPSDN